MSEQSLIINSNGGGSVNKTLAAGVNAVLQVDTPCQSLMVWTALTDCYFNFGLPASASNALLPAGVWTPIPMENTNLVQLISATGGAIYYVYRVR